MPCESNRSAQTNSIIILGIHLTRERVFYSLLFLGMQRKDWEQSFGWHIFKKKKLCLKFIQWVCIEPRPLALLTVWFITIELPNMQHGYQPKKSPLLTQNPGTEYIPRAGQWGEHVFHPVPSQSSLIPPSSALNLSPFLHASLILSLVLISIISLSSHKKERRMTRWRCN